MKPTVTWAKKTLRAVNKLIKQYKDGAWKGDAKSCPLCIATGYTDSSNQWNCAKCPG